MKNHRRLFEIKRGNQCLAIAVRTRGWHRTYIGFINGRVCATSPTVLDSVDAPGCGK